MIQYGAASILKGEPDDLQRRLHFESSGRTESPGAKTSGAVSSLIGRFLGFFRSLLYSTVQSRARE